PRPHRYASNARIAPKRGSRGPAGPDPPARAGEAKLPPSSHCGRRLLNAGNGLLEFGGTRLAEVQPPAVARMEKLGGLESVAGDADHYGLVALDPSLFDKLPQAGNDNAAGRFAQDPLGLGQQGHAFQHRILTTRRAPTSGGAHGTRRVTTVRRVADRQRLGDAVRPDGGHRIETALNRRTHRRATLRLGG